MNRESGLGNLAAVRAALTLVVVAVGAGLPEALPPAPSASTIPLPRPIRAAGRAPGTTTIPLPAPPAARAGARLEAALLPSQRIEPIDLATALRLAGARDLDIALARQRVAESLADLQGARALWLPSLFLGPTFYRADGQVQTVTGQVENVNRSSLYLGGTIASANGFPAPSPGTGYPQLNSLGSVLRISDAIYLPLAARRVVTANQAGIQAATNNALLAVSEAYFDLQLASGQLAIAGEAAANAERLTDLTSAYARSGQGLEADHRRALAELKHQRKLIRGATGRLKVASANLIRLLVLDPQLVVAPVEPAEAVVRLIPDDAPLDDLVCQGLRNRPELAQAQALIEAAQTRLKQARLRPFIPSVALTYAGGGLGGGQGSFFGNFGARGDVMASLFWEVHNLGFGDVAIMRRNEAQRETANIERTRVFTRVCAEVVASYEARLAASKELAEAGQALPEALESLALNFTNIRHGAGLPQSPRPIEVLQPIQALAQARADYLDAVLSYNRAQFRLKRAIGQP